ncbi:hypothetical protein SARC_08961 [Sphaeroforma arctica JP610]|uniref:F-box domain-containing protein n=1 Tax=Sphaeroforma arctica JP610 TaxID=667725 RepID=A0A0L0FP81_9EUKA|nr:hypothetical protein SARC_08961 [Sphaeroforma arctica JP610]KNC78615.1 hypothetical protein SARC_08961 [Sphaeroforma arctica JP610]|eukprot:XP_014152517.1 hypothetical protein SARC_08961 [Sphaeroforma arctica JP610]
MQFLDLCVDVRQSILSVLSRSDILHVSLTCKQFKADLEPFVVANILCHGDRRCTGQHRTIHGGLTTCFYATSLLPGCSRDTVPPLDVFTRALHYLSRLKVDTDLDNEVSSSYTCLNVLFGGICKVGLLDHARVMMGQAPRKSALHTQETVSSTSTPPVQEMRISATRKHRRPKKTTVSQSSVTATVANAPLRAYDIDAGSDNGYSLQWAVRHTDEEMVRFLCSLETVYPCKDAMEYAEVYKNRTITKLLKRLRMNRRHRDNVLRNMQAESQNSAP